jgi:spore maturation protein CgeB
MANESLSFVILGLSVTSSWGNGHATTYRGLIRELLRRGHQVLFLERDVPWYRSVRDLPSQPFGRCELYGSVEELESRFGSDIERADVVIQGSFVPEGIRVGEWLLGRARGLTAFYDIDTPVTIARMAESDCDYLSSSLVPRYDLYLSFSGGPVLSLLEKDLGARRAVALYCSVDLESHRPLSMEPRWDLGYMGTYSADRQEGLEELLVEPARLRPELRFSVAGAQYPEALSWPANVERIEHLPPPEHAAFYGRQRFTLNLTRREMRRLGHSPSVRLFEAAACGTPIISDDWAGLGELFRIGQEILLAHRSEEVVSYLSDLGERERQVLGERARARVLADHTAGKRAEELLEYLSAANASR